jgi:hypothetical protein
VQAALQELARLCNVVLDLDEDVSRVRLEASEAFDTHGKDSWLEWAGADFMPQRYAAIAARQVEGARERERRAMAVVAESKARQEAWYDDMRTGKISHREFARRLDAPADSSSGVGPSSQRAFVPDVEPIPEDPAPPLPLFLSSPEGGDDAASAAESGDESVKEVAAPGAITRVSSGAGASDREMVASKASPLVHFFCFSVYSFCQCDLCAASPQNLDCVIGPDEYRCKSCVQRRQACRWNGEARSQVKAAKKGKAPVASDPPMVRRSAVKKPRLVEPSSEDGDPVGRRAYFFIFAFFAVC